MLDADNWNGKSVVEIPPDALLVHANWTVGIANKKKILAPRMRA
jgi:hypothetical protein